MSVGSIKFCLKRPTRFNWILFLATDIGVGLWSPNCRLGHGRTNLWLHRLILGVTRLCSILVFGHYELCAYFLICLIVGMNEFTREQNKHWVMNVLLDMIKNNPMKCKYPSIHPLIFYTCLLLHSGRWGSAGAYPSWHGVKAELHPGQVTSSSQGQVQM